MQENAVFLMLGDGVDQYLNDATLDLRAAPHRLEMEAGLDRAWYGLMARRRRLGRRRDHTHKSFLGGRRGEDAFS